MFAATHVWRTALPCVTCRSSAPIIWSCQIRDNVVFGRRDVWNATHRCNKENIIEICTVVIVIHINILLILLMITWGSQEYRTNTVMVTSRVFSSLFFYFLFVAILSVGKLIVSSRLIQPKILRIRKIGSEIVGNSSNRSLLRETVEFISLFCGNLISPIRPTV